MYIVFTCVPSLRHIKDSNVTSGAFLDPVAKTFKFYEKMFGVAATGLVAELQRGQS